MNQILGSKKENNKKKKKKVKTEDIKDKTGQEILETMIGSNRKKQVEK